MLTPVLLLAVVVNIVGILNNYNIRNHQLDIRVKRDAAVPLLNDTFTTNDITDRNAPGDAPDGEELTKKQEHNSDVAYDLEDDLLVNYTGHNEAEANATVENEDTVPEETTIDYILAKVSDRGLIKSKDRFESTDNKGTEELTQKESDTEIINAVFETNNTDIPETADNGKILLINKIAEDLFKEEFDRRDAENKLDEKEEIEVIKELDDKLTKLKNNDDNKTREELTKYDNEIFDYQHANMLLDIILNLRNDDLIEKEKTQRRKRYAPNGHGSFNASPNSTWNGYGAIRYGGGPGHVRSSSGYSAGAPANNYINKQYIQPYPNNGNYNGHNTNYPYNNNNNAPYYNNYNNYYNQQPNDLRNRTNYPTYSINQNPTNYNQNYRNYNRNATYNSEPYFYNGNPGYNPSYRPIDPYGGNQNVAHHNSSGGGTYANSFYNNYYPAGSSRNTFNSDQYAAPAAPAAPGSTRNTTVTSNSTTAAPVIMGSCFMCGSFGCPQFFRKMGYLCVPLNEQ